MSRARPSTAQITRLFDNVAAPLYLVDDDRRIVYLNSACAAWLGLPAEELIGVKSSYHSPTDGSPVEIAAARLCPPPEVFSGQRATATIASASHAQPALHQAEFLPLVAESGEVALVMVVCGLPPAPHATPSIDEPDVALHEAVRRFRASQSERYRVDRLIGRSPAIVRAREQVRIASDSAASVLVVGARGTGKDQVARTIYNRGENPAGPLVPLDCKTLGVELLVSTLAAAVESHPSRESRPTGMLLLKDLDQLPREAQADFSRLIVTRGTSLQVVSTSSSSLDALVERREFPRELACALSTITIQLPPLTDRLDDLPLLAQVFLEEMNSGGGRQVSTFSAEALDLLAAHNWSVNLDELESVVASAHTNASGAVISPRDLPQHIHLAQEATARAKRTAKPIDLEAFLERVERELIERALARAKGNKSHAAKLLGMTRPRFYRRLLQLKLI